MFSDNTPLGDNQLPEGTPPPEDELATSNQQQEAQANPVSEISTPETEITDTDGIQASAVTDDSPDSTDELVESEDMEVYEEIDDAEDEEDSTESATGLKRGMLVEGVILKTSPTEIIVNLGEHGEGIINSRELERLTSSTLQSLQIDEPILVYVLSASNEDGQAVLSISRALEESDWRQAEEYYENKEIYQGKVAGYNKGGLIVRFGRLRGFVPASQISIERREHASGDDPEDRWGTMIGEAISVKVVEIKRSRNRLILSEQAAAREVRELQKSRLLDELKEGEKRTGRVTSLTDFGAFVDLGGADGLVHLTELSWKHITHPGDVVQVGQEVTVEVISVDRKNNRIGLSLRRLEQDPWSSIDDNYKSGQLIQATITKLTKFGAFARPVDQPEIEGLVHVSELSEHRVKHPREVVSKGDVLTLRIIKIDREQRRLGLSLKLVDSPEYLDVDWGLADND
jgi:small subunit ribosomal protein S1